MLLAQYSTINQNAPGVTKSGVKSGPANSSKLKNIFFATLRFRGLVLLKLFLAQWIYSELTGLIRLKERIQNGL